jgi:uncharacterized protein (TIGR03435 family)
MLLRFAYSLQNFQMDGGPSWIDSDHFDILAKAEGRPSEAQLRIMVRTLLIERFKLVVHMEKRESPFFSMVLAREGGVIGPQLRRSVDDCIPAVPTGAPIPAPDPHRPPLCGVVFPGPGRITAGGVTMSEWSRDLSGVLGRVVIDNTGLNGRFDITLQFASPDPLPPSTDPFASKDRPGAEGPSMYTALLEQLGLKLEATKGPVDALVIDRVEHPTEE